MKHENLSHGHMRKLSKAILAFILIIFVFLAIFPFAYMITVSLIEDAATVKLSWNIIRNATWSLENYKKVFITSNFSRYIINSALVSLLSCAMACLFSSMAAYAFSKKRFRGRDHMRAFYLMTMMVPGECMIIPLYLIIRKLGLVNTLFAMAIPYASGAFGTMLMYSFMKSLPDELLEAADIDGCSEIRKFVTIVLPLVKSAIISLAIFTFIGSWGQLLMPMITTTKLDLSTVTMAVARMSGGMKATNFGYVMAGSTLAFLPPFVLYIFLQRQFVEGIALSGTKT